MKRLHPNVLLSALFAVPMMLALHACAKPTPPIAGTYRTDTASFRLDVQTTSQLVLTIAGLERRASFEQDGANLTIKSTDTRTPRFELAAEVVKDGQAIRFVRSKDLDTGDTHDFKGVVLSHEVP